MENPESRILKTRIWLKERFREYYKNVDIIYVPENIHQREFGFGSFSKKIAVRHRGFKDKRGLLDYIKNEAPAHVNHSTARYRFPETDMANKERLGTDLIFDIDVGDLNLACAREHGEGWICENCFQTLKNETLKLRDLLSDDFGFDKKGMVINFSGSRGYHLRIQNEEVLELDEKARREITNYLSFEIKMEDLIKEVSGRIYGPRPREGGLRGRVARTVIDEIEKDERIPDKEGVIEQITEGNWGAFPRGYGLKKISEYARNAALKIPVDSKVTTDLTHLIRLPESLHGGSGLLAKIIRDLDSFDPMKECFVFGDEEINLRILKKVPEFTAKDQKFGPFSEGKQKVPRFVAVFLGCKGFGVVDENQKA